MYLRRHAICSAMARGYLCLFLEGTKPWTLAFSADSSKATLTLVQGDSTITIDYAVTDKGTPVDPSTLNGIAMTLPSGENQTLFSGVQILAREVVRDGATIDSLQIYSEDCGCNFIKFGR